MKVLLMEIAFAGACSMAIAQPKYVYKHLCETLPDTISGTWSLQQFNLDNSVVALTLGGGRQRIWDGTQWKGPYDNQNIQLNSSGEVIRNYQFRRTLDGPVEEIPKYDGLTASIVGLNDRGDVFGYYPVSLGGHFGGIGGIPFIYNVRTGALTIPPKPAEHTEPNGMVTNVDNTGRYIILGWFDQPSAPLGSTFVEPGRVSRFGMLAEGAARLNNTGGCVYLAKDQVSMYFLRNGVHRLLPSNTASLSDDDMYLTNIAGSGGPNIIEILNDGFRTTSLSSLTLNLPSDIKIYRGHMRSDGAVAAITERNGKFSISTFTPVPEPASLIALGIGCLVLRRRK